MYKIKAELDFVEIYSEPYDIGVSHNRFKKTSHKENNVFCYIFVYLLKILTNFVNSP